MFDAVFNHMSAQGDWFQRFLRADPAFRDFFVTVEGSPDLSRVVRPRALPLLTAFQTATGPRKVWTTFSADQVDLDVRDPRVLLALVDALLFYVEQGAKFIRLDAIAYLWKEIGTTCIHLPQTHRIIQLLRAVLDELAPQVMLITETNVPHADNLSYFGDGTNEAQLVYNFALPPLVLHSLATGNAAKLTRWAQSLQLPSDRVTFFNFLASHDGIGLNPARGILNGVEIDALVQRAQDHGGFVSYKHNSDGSKSPYELNINYFDALSNPAATEPLRTQIDRFICAQSIMLSLAGVPGLYFHSLFGSRGDRAGAEASGIPRRINRQKFERAKLEAELLDPSNRQAMVFTCLKHFLQQRRAFPAFHPAAPQNVLECDDRVFAILRTTRNGDNHLLCLHNVSNQAVSVQVRLPEHSVRRFRERGSLSGEVLQCILPPYEVCRISTEPQNDPVQSRPN
jgi:sucrose phosphorylase